jgi:hypothetical protein
MRGMSNVVLSEDLYNDGFDKVSISKPKVARATIDFPLPPSSWTKEFLAF